MTHMTGKWSLLLTVCILVVAVCTAAADPWMQRSDDLDGNVNALQYHENSADTSESGSEETGLRPVKRNGRLVKKIKPLVFNGYSMDINIEAFKSLVSVALFRFRQGWMDQC